MLIYRWLFTAITLFSFSRQSYAYVYADTVHYTLPDAEKIFLERNLELIAKQFDINITKAYLQQARYWDNPVLNTDQNIYDGKFFRHDANYGQVFIQIQQLIRTAGKRNKLIQLSKDGVLTAEQQFTDMMRNLRFLLRTDFFSIYELLETNKIYETESVSLQNLVKGMDAQFRAGNISQKDNIRVKSLLYSLQTDQANLQTRLSDIQKDIHLLLRFSGDTTVVPVFIDQNTMNPDTLNIQQLFDSARANRPDLQLAKTNLISQQHNLSYQKALAVPDLTLAVEYDQRSSYINNYYGLGISLPIPLLNTNKGNIKAATYSISQAQTQLLQQQNESEQEVASAYNKLLIASSLKKKQPIELLSDYDYLLQHMVTSYEQKQVSLLEFIDFFDSYKDTKIKQLQQQTALYSAAAELDYTTGSNIITIP